MQQEPPKAPTATSAEEAVLFVALELSRASWLVAVQAPGGDKISRHKLAAGASAELLELVGRQRAKTERRTGRTVRVMTCYEAGRDGFWLHRLLVANGVENLVIDPASVAVNRRARRAKTDRIDVETLLRAMMAHARGERRVCSVVRVPTPEAEDARRLTREREALLGERVRHVNRVKALCALQGAYDFEPLRPRAAERLERLVAGDGRPFPERLKAEIRPHPQRRAQGGRQLP